MIVGQARAPRPRPKRAPLTHLTHLPGVPHEDTSHEQESRKEGAGSTHLTQAREQKRGGRQYTPHTSKRAEKRGQAVHTSHKQGRGRPVQSLLYTHTLPAATTSQPQPPGLLCAAIPTCLMPSRMPTPRMPPVMHAVIELGSAYLQAEQAGQARTGQVRHACRRGVGHAGACRG